MIDLMGVRLPQGGHAILLTADIGGAVSDIHDASRTVVYTDTFPDGITIEMPIEEFYTLWMTCLLSDYELVDVETADIGSLH